MPPVFKTIQSERPWYKKTGSIFSIGVFVVLGAVTAFLLKGSESALVGRVKAYDVTSPVCAWAIGWRGLKEDATRNTFEEILATGHSEKEKPAPEQVRRACAYALGMSKQAHAAPYLIDALQNDPSIPVRCTVVRALAKTQEPIGAEPLWAAMAHQEGDLRAAAAEACRYFGDKRSIDKLIDHLDDGLPEVRRNCHESLVILTGTMFDGTDEKREWRKWRETH
jgi:HEAT repeat protein